MKHARHYLQDGTMPEFGTTCANEVPILWPPPGNGGPGTGTSESKARRDSKSEALDKASADWEEMMRRFAW